MPELHKNITYGTGSVDDEADIQNYLATSDPENLQFLTINDTTFVTNRDSSNSNTLVGQTGSTFDRPEPHCAMIELLRTEMDDNTVLIFTIALLLLATSLL